MPSDEERCRLIAELEEYGMAAFGEHGEIRGRGIIVPPDYAHDLTATMWAARRLPDSLTLVVMSTGRACFQILKGWDAGRLSEPDIGISDPARAAFLALSDYLAGRTK